ncbi:lipid-A-disaccharide synthase N-terminal domain-containing protein [Lichenihabitans psoromatis]|uniref:lipid-A-disaccharide synthase N-terminal domain-containing protein n=1 Tax=Lichenihabitans psoromatis TaxID=2528642 RepID=UPI003CCAF0F8
MYSLSLSVETYLHEVFVDKFDIWFAFGLVAQLVFTGRFLVQWIESEREGRSVIPVAFWVLSLLGGVMTLIYGFVRHDAIIILGQVLAVFIYTRNLILIARNARRAKRQASSTTEAEPDGTASAAPTPTKPITASDG